MATTTTRNVLTTHGLISTTLSYPASIPSPTPPTLLLIHGNSSSSLIFRPILTSPSLSSTHPILTLDLPGHGLSAPASSPARTYTQRGYAEAVLEVLTQYPAVAHSLVILGWSLGGHVAIELVALLRDLHAGLKAPPEGEQGVRVRGVMLVGTPPANGAEQTAKGFRGDAEHLSAAAKEVLSEDEFAAFAKEGLSRGFEEWMEEGVRKTEGRARKLMFEAFGGGKGVDQVGVVESEKSVLWGVVNGADEPYVNLDYLDGLNWARLWREKCMRLVGLKHTPFWEDWDAFGPLFESFVSDCGKE